MDRSSPDNKQNPPLPMEVTMTTQLENLLVTREDAIQTQAEETDRLPLGSVCENENRGGEESNKCLHTETSSACLPEMSSHNLPSKKEGKEMEVTMVTHKKHVSVTRDDATPANTHTEADETGAVQTAASAAMLPGNFGCKTDCVDEDSEDSDSDSSSSSSSSSTSSSSSSSSPAPVFEDVDEGFSQPVPIKARDEVLLEELPAVEEVSVSLPEEAELQPMGTVSSIVQQLVIIQSLKDTPPLNEDSILFRSDRVAVGKVFEVFGPVCSPLYVLRFNSSDQISSKGLAEGSTVYYAPALKEYTEYILTQQLKLLKGSDASWKNDDEPPVEALDYSDDEKEQEAKRKIRNNKRKENGSIDKSSQQHSNDRRSSQSRHTRPRVRHQHPRNAPPPSAHSYPPPGHTEIPPSYFPTHSPYLPPPHHPFSPPSFPLYPPPPLPPPAFFNPSFSHPFWPPNSVPYVDFPPPPPPPHPPSPPH
ncbi:uncharacterized protein FYW61_014869 isoform 1-T2 [Anableps anableps]